MYGEVPFSALAIAELDNELATEEEIAEAARLIGKIDGISAVFIADELTRQLGQIVIMTHPDLDQDTALRTILEEVSHHGVSCRTILPPRKRVY